MAEQDVERELDDAALVLAARREVDPLLHRLVVQPLDPDSIGALTRWLVEVYPQARSAMDRLDELAPSTPGTGRVAPVAGADRSSRALTVVRRR